MLDPEAATLPPAAGHNNTLQISLIVLVSVHANLHIALYRERGKLYSWTSSTQNRCQHLYHKRERRGVALNASAEREGKGTRREGALARVAHLALLFSALGVLMARQRIQESLNIIKGGITLMKQCIRL